MPACMTWLLWVLVPIPGRGSRSRTHTLRPSRAIASAAARPTTPPPTTAVSMVSMHYNRRSLKVPLLDLHAQYAPLRSEILEAVARVCDTQQFIMGPEVQRLEEERSRALSISPGLSRPAKSRSERTHE